MIELSTPQRIYRYCSTCRIRMIIRYDDGDVLSVTCPEDHEGIVFHKTIEGLRRYAIKLFQPPASTVGIGAKED